MNEKLNENIRLAKGPWKALCGDLVEKDEFRGALTARLLENTKQHMANNRLNEDTTISNVGVWDKFAMPIIRAVFPNLVATDLVSVQPMEGPTSQIFFLETRYANTKGSITKGQTNFSVLDGHGDSYQFTSEKVDAEVVGTGTGSEDNFTATLAWIPVRPHSVRITAGAVVVVDDGDGTLSGTGLDSGTIDYATGEVVLDFTANVSNGVKINAAYEYNSEGNSLMPQIDLMITARPVQARSERLRARWSVEAAQDLKAVQSLDAEAELMAFLAEELRFNVDRSIIRDIESVSDGTTPAWSKTPPDGVGYYEHKLTFIDTLVAASQLIYKKTRRASANRIVCGTQVASIIETLPNFRPTKVDGVGVVHMGNLQGRWEVYKDPYLTETKALVLYKGNSLLDTGYVYAPYIPLYRTPTIFLDDMVGRVGFMTRFAKAIVSPYYYASVSITA